MYVVSVIPLAKIPLPAPQALDYFYVENISPGCIVQISLGSRKILGVVRISTPLTQQRQKIKRSPFQLKKIERVVTQNPLMPRHYLELVAWCAKYFYSPLGLVTRALLPQIFSKPTIKFLEELRLLKIAASSTAELNAEYRDQKPILYWAHHNTNSKIKFYRHAIRQTLAHQKSVLFLVPELYKIEQFRTKIPELEGFKTAHGGLSPTVQYKIWRQTLRGEVRGIIGTRSAVAMPLCDLGLIIVDEEESPFYKSFDRQPYINSKTVALKLAKLTGAKIILGTNLPSVETLWKEKEGEYTLKKPKITSQELQNPEVSVVDMRKELKNENFSILSKKLQTQLKIVAEKNQQAILFINRRGLSSGLICRDCGHTVKCPNCDVPMVFHMAFARHLICHHCGHRQKPPTVCPKCESYRIKFVGAGTQRVEQEVEKLCAENKLFRDTCRIVRLDTDATPSWTQQKLVFYGFSAKRHNILIGTQLMLKEDLLPKVHLAAFITIDPLLSLPDFRIGDQIVRIVDKLWATSMTPVILQTYLVDSYIINNVLSSLLSSDKPTKNTSNLLRKVLLRDIAERRELSLPPFSQLIRLAFVYADSQGAEREAQILKNKLEIAVRNLKLETKNFEILGPAPGFIPRIKNRYIWQIMIRSKIEDLSLRNAILRVVPSNWKIDVDPVLLL